MPPNISAHDYSQIPSFALGQNEGVNRPAFKASSSVAGESNLVGIKLETAESDIRNSGVSKNIDSARTSYDSNNSYPCNSKNGFVSIDTLDDRDSLSSRDSEEDGETYETGSNRGSFDSTSSEVNDERHSENDGPTHYIDREELDRGTLVSNSGEIGASSPSQESGWFPGKFLGRAVTWISNAVESCFSKLRSCFSVSSFGNSFTLSKKNNKEAEALLSGEAEVVKNEMDPARREALNQAAAEVRAVVNPMHAGETKPSFTKLYVVQDGRRLTGEQLNEEAKLAQENAASKAQKAAEEKAIAAPLEAKKAAAAEATLKKDEISNIQDKYFSVCQKLLNYNLENNTKFKDASGTKRSFPSDDSKKKFQEGNKAIEEFGEILDKHSLQGISIENASSFKTNKPILGTIKKDLEQLQSEHQIVRDELLKTVGALSLTKDQEEGCKALIETIGGPFEERIASALKAVGQALEAIKQHPNDPVEQAIVLFLGKEVGGQVIQAIDTLADNVFHPVMDKVDQAANLLPSEYRKQFKEMASFAMDVEDNR